MKVLCCIPMIKMRCLTNPGFFILLMILLPVFVPAQNSENPLVTVMDFELSGISEAEGRLLIDFISNTVRETNRYRIIDRAQRNAILEEQEFSLSGCTDVECQLEVGKLLSANLMFVGSIGRIGDRFILNMKLVDVATGETIDTASEKYTDLNSLVDDSNRLVLGMLGTGKSQTVSEPEPAEEPVPQKTESTGFSDSDFISYTPASFFKPAFYTFRGEEYRFRYFQGFSQLIETIQWSLPSGNIEYETVLEDYLKDVKKYRTYEITGISSFVVGCVCLIIGLGSENDTLAGIGIIGYVTGVALNMVGGMRLAKPPAEIVNYYNLQYAGR